MNGGMRVKREGILRKGTMAVTVITIAAALAMSGCAAGAGTQDGISTEATGETQTQTPEETLSQEAATQDTASQEQTTTQEQKETQTTTAAETTAQTYEFEQGLYEFYKDDFMVGVALPGSIVKNEGKKLRATILDNFNSMTCENEMKPDALLDKAACQANLEETYTNPVVKFDSCAPAVKFALDNGIRIRLHTLVWHSQTPGWFFTEDYTDNGALVSRDVMLARMENYIKTVLTYFDENYPELI